MRISRRSFLKAQAATVAALGLGALGLGDARKLLAAGTPPPVLWLQAQACTGDSVSLLNSASLATVDELLLGDLDLRFHPNLSAAAGATAVAAVEAVREAGGYVLVVEGAVPTGAGGAFCQLWPGLTALDAVRELGLRADAVLAVGTCASFGGVPAARPNPTGAVGVREVLGTAVPVVNLPGCPANPDWIVGTLAHLLEHGSPPPLDAQLRPTEYFGRLVHDQCPYKDAPEGEHATELGQPGCLYALGCCGPSTHADCPSRRWHSPGKGQPGTNWCVQAGAPCQGCTEPGFPDARSPFYTPTGPRPGGQAGSPEPPAAPALAPLPPRRGRTAVVRASGCFVVTAVCGDVDHPTVRDLRAFRERCLRRRWWGERLIALYERFGPRLAAVVARRPGLRAAVAPLLGWLARLTRPGRSGAASDR